MYILAAFGFALTASLHVTAQALCDRSSTICPKSGGFAPGDAAGVQA